GGVWVWRPKVRGGASRLGARGSGASRTAEPVRGVNWAASSLSVVFCGRVVGGGAVGVGRWLTGAPVCGSKRGTGGAGRSDRSGRRNSLLMNSLNPISDCPGGRIARRRERNAK